MDERTSILGRVREALRTKAPKPGHVHSAQLLPHTHASAPMPRDPALQIGAWLPAVGETFEERLAAFAKQSQDLKTDFFLAENRAAAEAKLKEVARLEAWSRVATHQGELTTPACQALALPTLVTDSGYSKLEMEQCNAGVTECDALVAQTGSVMITARSAGGRALSVLPPHHVVLARREQLLRDLPAAFAYLHQAYHGKYPSFMSVITGPSRTGDIERILVLGAHGPKKLTIICH